MMKQNNKRNLLIAFTMLFMALFVVTPWAATEQPLGKATKMEPALELVRPGVEGGTGIAENQPQPEENATQNPEEQIKLHYYDVANDKYYDYNPEVGVPWIGTPYRIVAEIPEGWGHFVHGDAQVNAGTYNCTLHVETNDANIVIQDREVILKINTVDKDMSQTDFNNSNILADGQLHTILATNLREDVSVWYECPILNRDSEGNPIIALPDNSTLFKYWRECSKL